MRRIAVFGTALLAGGLLWMARPASGNSAQALVEGLNGPNAVNCYSDLRQLEDEKTDAAIIAGTKHSSARVRGQCARLLGQRQDVTMAAVLTPMLSDPEAAVRNQAARSLWPLLDDEEMVALLRSGKLSSGSQLVMVGALLRDPGAITNKGLLDWLLDRSHRPEVRVGNYLALRHHRSLKPLPGLLSARRRIAQQALQDALDAGCAEEVRCAALPLYAALSGSSAYSQVLGFVKAPQPTLREASLVGLAETRDARAWPLLCKFALDNQQSPGFRVAALNGLRHLARTLDKGKETFPIFCRVAENVEEPVEARAVALTSMRPYRFELNAVRIANQALTDKHPLIRQKGAHCLSGLGDSNADLSSPFWLAPHLEKVKQVLASETDAEAQCAMKSAVCTLETRIASRGK